MLCLSPLPRVVSSSSLQQGLQVRQKWPREIQLYLFHHLTTFLFHFVFFYNTIIKTAEKQVPSAHCTKNTRVTLTMKSSPADEHLLFLFCYGVSLPICLILLFLCLSASPPLFQMIMFNTCVSSCFVVHWLLDHTAPSLLTHQFITHPSKNVIAENVFFHLCLLLSPLQQDLQVSKSDLERDATSLYHSFFVIDFYGFVFCVHFFCLQCRSSAVQFLSDPWILFCSKSNVSLFIYC